MISSSSSVIVMISDDDADSDLSLEDNNILVYSRNCTEMTSGNRDEQ